MRDVGVDLLGECASVCAYPLRDFVAIALKTANGASVNFLEGLSHFEDCWTVPNGGLVAGVDRGIRS